MCNEFNSNCIIQIVDYKNNLFYEFQFNSNLLINFKVENVKKNKIFFNNPVGHFLFNWLFLQAIYVSPPNILMTNIDLKLYFLNQQ